MTNARTPMKSRPNSRITRLGDSTTQLSYALQMTHDSLSASLPNQNPVLADFELVISNVTAANIAVQSIAFTIQVGEDAPQLAPFMCDLTNSSVSDSVNWQITNPGPVGSSDSATYLLGPAVGSSVILATGASLVVELLAIPINTQVGTTLLSITETLDVLTGGSTTFGLTKFPYDFYFANLTANVNDDAGSTWTPVVQVPYDTAVTLLWDGSVAEPSAYAVYYSSNGGQQQSNITTMGEWTSPSGLMADTEFMVEVTVTEPGGQPVTHVLSTAVKVQQPDSVVNSLQVGGTLLPPSAAGTIQVAGSSALGGDVTVGSTPVPANLTVNGTSTLEGDVTVNGTLTLDGAATVGTGTPPANLTVNGDVNATDVNTTGNVSAEGALSVAGNALVGGTLGVTGEVTLPQLSVDVIQIGAWTISEDGNGNLVFGSSGASFVLNPTGDFTAPGPLYANGGNNRAICDGDTIGIYEFTSDGYLNGSGKIDGGGADGWAQGTYWMSAPPDSDSTLRITYGDPSSSAQVVGRGAAEQKAGEADK